MKDGNASFPSGDVAGAVVFGASVAKAGWPGLGMALILGSAFGRVYWRAHHVLDVCAGGLFGAVAAKVMQSVVVKWWHPLAAHVALIGFMVQAHRAVKH